jgi:hypothetical protein
VTETVIAHSNISDEMRAAVGREIGRRVSYPVTDSDIRRWALAVHYPEQPPRSYWDADHAAASPYGGIVAPLDFNPFAWLDQVPGFAQSDVDINDPDKTEKTLGITPPGLKHQLNGGLTVRYGVRMRPGDVITAATRLGEYTERTGRLGLMLFTPMEDTWTNQRGEVVKSQSIMLIRY